MDTRFWDDRINPVLIKELRQAFHNRLMLSLSGILLVLQFAMLVFFHLTQKEWTDGGGVFVTIDAVLMNVAILIACAYGPLQRFTEERSSSELDFAAITLLTPFQVIFGKLACALVTALLVASLCLPFMTVAYFFRNVTLLEIAGVFISEAVPVLLMVQLALFCGALGKKWGQALFLIAFLQVAGPLFIGSPVLFNTAVLKGSPERFLFWGMQVGGVLVFLLLFVSTTSLITPRFANRMFPPRLLGMGCFVLYCCVAFIPGVFRGLAGKAGREFEEMFLCCCPLALTAFLVLLAVCDREEPGARVLSQVPRNFFGRLCHFLLSSNRTGGVLCLLPALFLFFTGAVTTGVWGKHTLVTLAVTAGLCGYLVFYGECAVLLSRLVPKVPGWVWLLIVGAFFGAVCPLIADGTRVKLDEIFVSPLQLTGLRVGDFASRRASILPDLSPSLLRVCIGPALAALSGVWFIIDGVKKFRAWRAPAPVPAVKEKGDGIVKR